VRVACTLEQVFPVLVYGQVCTSHRCAFYTNVHIYDKLAASCAHMGICIYVCICMHIYIDAHVCL